MLTPTATDHKVTLTHTLTGQWSTILDVNKNCALLRHSDNTQFKMIRSTGLAGAVTEYDVSSLVATVSTSKTTFTLSTSCDMFAVDKFVFSFSSGYRAVTNDFTSLMWDATDESLTYLFVASANTVYKYNSGTNTYDSYVTGISAVYTSSSMISASSDRVLMWAITTTSANIVAFLDNG